jgi:uncharacterized protein (DUF2132 family)
MTYKTGTRQDDDDISRRCIDILAVLMKPEQQNNPLHGKTLEIILHYLIDTYGWEQLGARIKIKCFNDNPSIQSSLKFLRKTPWARKKVENLYLENRR